MVFYNGSILPGSLLDEVALLDENVLNVNVSRVAAALEVTAELRNRD